MMDYFEMGGYAAYIWPAYGITLLVMVGLLVKTLSAVKSNQATLDALEKSGVRRRAPAEKIVESAS